MHDSRAVTLGFRNLLVGLDLRARDHFIRDERRHWLCFKYAARGMEPLTQNPPVFFSAQKIQVDQRLCARIGGPQPDLAATFRVE
jgi:hypothetical protein